MVKLPSPFCDLPREPLLYSHPSPIEPLIRLSAEISPSGSTKFWVKREDSNSGLACGGNKVRKLEYVLPDAIKAGATTLVTTGGLQSNHMRQVAATAARYGLKTHLIPEDRVKSEDPEYRKLGNIQITHLLGATHALNDSEVEQVLQSSKDRGEIPYWIPSGASTHPLGGCGFARFAFEVAEQEREINIFFDTIVVPCASGSTLGGIIAGFKLLEQTSHSSPHRTLIGIDVFAAEPGKSEKVVLDIAKTTARKIGLSDAEITERDVLIDRRWNGGTYGFVDNYTQDAIRFLARLEGILTDPVYTGKAIAGLIRRARENEFEGCPNVLFVHTGGIPALSAYPDVR